MKILILANNDLGLYNFRKELIERLILEKNEIYISLPNGKRVKDLEESGCKYIETEVDRRGTNPVKDCKLLLKYFKILKQIKPNIVLTYTIKPNINTGTVVGRHCIVNTCSSLDHDNILEDYVHISPGSHLAGTVKISEGTWICTGVTVINNITIGKNNVIGAGATVIKNIEEENSTFIGVPVKKNNKNKVGD